MRSGQGTTTFVYNSGGSLIAEYGAEPTTPNTGTSYLTTDHLGSTRVVTNDSQAVVSRHDYLPFGEEITLLAGGRTGTSGGGLGYEGADDTRQKFTSKERDDESNLDYFGLRYCSTPEGRFTSPDTIIHPKASKKGAVGYLQDPQNWNKYTYVSNNPLLYVDDDGAEGGLHYEKAKDGTPTVTGPNINPKAGYVMGATAAVGTAVLLGEYVPPVARIIVGLAARNPDTVLKIGQGMLESSTGGPTPPTPQEVGTEIGQSVRQLAAGKMEGIASQVSQKGFAQADAVAAIQSAVKATGRDSVAVELADKSVAVMGVKLGVAHPVIIVNKAGQAVKTTADTAFAGIVNGKPVFTVTNIKQH